MSRHPLGKSKLSCLAGGFQLLALSRDTQSIGVADSRPCAQCATLAHARGVAICSRLPGDPGITLVSCTRLSFFDLRGLVWLVWFVAFLLDRIPQLGQGPCCQAEHVASGPSSMVGVQRLPLSSAVGCAPATAAQRCDELRGRCTKSVSSVSQLRRVMKPQFKE